MQNIGYDSSFVTNNIGYGGWNAGFSSSQSGSVAPPVVLLPTVSVTSPFESFYFDKTNDIVFDVTGSCENASSVEVFASVNGAAFSSWGTDSVIESGIWSVRRTLQAGDIGTLSLKAVAQGSSTSVSSSFVAGAITDAVANINSLSPGVLLVAGKTGSSNFVSDASGISQWSDVSGNGNHAVQATTASRPFVSTVGDDTYVSFIVDSTYTIGKQFTLTSNTWVSTKSAITVVAAVEWSNNGVEQSFFGCDSTDFAISRSDTNKLRVKIGASIYGDVAIDNDPHIIAVKFNGAGVGNAGRLRVWIDDVEQTLSFTGTIPAAIATVTTSRFGRTGTNTLPMMGAAYAFAGFGSALSDANILYVSNQLKGLLGWASSSPTTVSILTLSNDWIFDRVYDVTVPISGTCSNASSITTQVNINGTGYASWDSDLTVSNGTWDTTRTIQATDVGPMLIRVVANGLNGKKVTSRLRGGVSDVRGLVTTYDGFEIDVPTTTVTKFGTAAFTNQSFSTDTAWTKGTGWTIPGSLGADHASGATSSISQDPGQEVGLESSVTFTLSSVNGGNGVRAKFGSTNGTLRTSPGTYTEHGIQATNTTIGIEADTNTVCTIDDASCTSLSVRSLTLTAAGGTFTGSTFGRSTAIYAPYKHDTDTLIGGRQAVLFGTSRSLNTSLASSNFTFLNYNAGASFPKFTLSFVISSALTNATNFLVSSCTTAAGIKLYATSAGAVTLIVQDSLGASLATATSADGVLTANVSAIVTVLSDGGNTYVRVNGTQVASATYSGTQSNTTPANGFLLGNATGTGGTSNLLGMIGSVYCLKSNCTLSELSLLEDFAMKRFSI